MKSFVALALFGAVSALTEDEAAFMGYITQFGKSYATKEEYAHRLTQFARNRHLVLEHNANVTDFKLGFNMMSDWTEAEYKAILTHKPMPEADKVYGQIPESNEPVANSIDWRSSGKVQKIKDQGQCGSCWSFSAVSAMESSHAIKSGSLLSFSEQQLVDCSTANYGCNGGW
jgi:cathepsin L